jgi:predicted nucleotidyltransferase
MNENLDKIRDSVLDVLLPYGVEEVSLFGSRARADARPDSDLDLLVRFEEPPRLPLGIFAWIELERKMSERCGYKVDLVSERALKKHIRPYIEQDKIIIYEAR